jgi:hypothetical protein
MKTVAMFSLCGTFLLPYTLAADLPHNLKCDILEEGSKIIRCTYSSVRLEKTRTIQFVWRSETTPHDDRERTLSLPALHGSVYDYRYYYGRAPGKWEVAATDLEGHTLATTTFTLP